MKAGQPKMDSGARTVRAVELGVEVVSGRIVCGEETGAGVGVGGDGWVSKGVGGIPPS